MLFCTRLSAARLHARVYVPVSQHTLHSPITRQRRHHAHCASPNVKYARVVLFPWFGGREQDINKYAVWSVSRTRHQGLYSRDCFVAQTQVPTVLERARLSLHSFTPDSGAGAVPVASLACSS